MKEREDKKIEKLVEAIMKDSKLDTPSLDFTANVMSKVKQTTTNEVYNYQSLISNNVFIFVFGFFITFFFFLKPSKEDYIYRISDSFFYSINKISNFSYSKITIYSVSIFSLLLLIQILFLKKHFKRQLEK